jgi:hypothetical protein
MLAIKSDSEFNRFFKGANFHNAGVLGINFHDIDKNKKKIMQKDEDEDMDYEMEG